MPTKTVLLEIDVEEGEDAAVKELLAYLAYTKRIKKYLWREKEPAAPGQTRHTVHKEGAAKHTSDKPVLSEAGLKEQKSPTKQAGHDQTDASSQMIASMLDLLMEWKRDNKLIRLKALKGKGKILDIACKIVSHDSDTGILTVYDVDRKVVEAVRVTEIEDINAAL